MSDPDDLADLLAPQSGNPSPEMQAGLLRQTEQHVLRFRWKGRVRTTVLAVVLLAIGITIGWFARPTPQTVETHATRAIAVPVIVPVPIPALKPLKSNSPKVPNQLTAAEAELQAELADEPSEAARFYRLAGDAFLNKDDYRNASRCYCLFLARAGDDALSTVPGDTWLLTSLKNDAYREKFHVAKTDD